MVYPSSIIMEGGRHGTRPVFPHTPAPRTALPLPWHVPVLGVATGPSHAGSDDAHVSQANQDAFQRPEALSGADPQAFDACEQAAEPCHQAPSAPRPLFTCTRGRRRQVDTQHQFCPDHACDYYGWVGLNHIRANGHPGSGPWRQLPCVACNQYFQETHGTPLHGTHVPPEMWVWAVGALAEGLGIREIARVFEVDPNSPRHNILGHRHLW
jgi:hypothetical protein